MSEPTGISSGADRPPPVMPAPGQPTAWQRFKQAVDAHEFAWLPPWSAGGTARETDVRHVRRLALHLIRRQMRQPAVGSWLQAAAWPFLLPVKAWLMARDRELPGFGSRLWAGCRDLVVYNLRPDAMRALRAQRPDGASLARLYVPDRENQAILIALSRHTSGARIGDKIAFHHFCQTHALPHIPLVAHSGEPSGAPDEQWRQQDLFLKSNDLWCGIGAEPLRFDPARNCWHDRRGQLVTAANIRTWANATHEGEHWLIQPMLQVDPTWADWSPGPLGTVRVVTVIVRPGDAPEIIAASMRLPRRKMIVDNFSAGALSAEIDWTSGTLQPALSRSGRTRWHHHHPDTGAAITGAKVPRWSEICTLALRAHAQVPDLMAVGWDVSCHDGHPILIEANPVFNLAPTVVLGETRWLEAVRHREPALRQVLEADDT